MSDWDWQTDDLLDRATRSSERVDWDEQLRYWEQERVDRLRRDIGERNLRTHDERVRDAGYELGDPKGREVEW